MVFFDPRKWNPVEKRLLLGGLVGSLSYWLEQAAQAYVPQMPAELNSRLEEHLPTNGALVASIAPPATLYLVGKVSKTTATKEKLSDLTLGSALYCFPSLMNRTICRAAGVEGIKARPATIVAPATMSKYNASAPAPLARNMSAGLSKYVLTA